MSKSNLSFLISLALILPSGATALHLANQPQLTDAQQRVLDTSIQICSAGSMGLFGTLASQRTTGNKKQ